MNEKTLNDLRSTLSKVSAANNADIILYSGAIYPPGDKELIKLVRKYRRNENVVLMLTTTGGLPDCAYRIARCLQRAYEGKFILLVDTICKSAGTLIALGADEIVMTVTGELGPLDVQLSKPDALAEQTSGLTPKQAIITLQRRAFESLEDFFLALRFRSGLQITTRTALDVATKLTTGIYCPIFEQIDPMRMGEISRAMLIAEEYGKRLSSNNVLEETLEALVENYPSHGFVIDREEASELFANVRKPTDEEEYLANLTEPFTIMGQESNEPIVEFLSILIPNEEEEVEEGENVSTGENHGNEVGKNDGNQKGESSDGKTTAIDEAAKGEADGTHENEDIESTKSDSESDSGNATS